MQSIDPNYQSRKSYLTTWVDTCKTERAYVRLAEVISAVACLILLPIIQSPLAFILSGAALYGYLKVRARVLYKDEKMIYIAPKLHFPHSSQRDLQIYIHPEIVHYKLAKAADQAINVPMESYLAEHVANAKCLDKQNRAFIQSMMKGGAVLAQSPGRHQSMEDVSASANFKFRAGMQNYHAEVHGIFDGHHGSLKISEHRLAGILKKHLEAQNAIAYTSTATFNALKLAMLELNECMKGHGGSTGVIATLIENRIWVANVGDSRAFILTPDRKLLPLTKDARVSKNGIMNSSYAKPALARGAMLDKHHIYNQGGHRLAMLRSLGDHSYKTIARPKISVFDIVPGFQGVLVLISDGIIESCKMDEVGGYILDLMNKKIPLSDVASKIIEISLAMGAKDNQSCLIKQL